MLTLTFPVPSSGIPDEAARDGSATKSPVLFLWRVLASNFLCSILADYSKERQE